MKRAGLYCRVSTDSQVREGDSLDSQKEALVKYCKHNGYEVAGIYVDDGISGTKFDERDELQRLLEDVKMGRIDVIFFTRLDRWFRNVRHYLNVQDILDKHNVPWTAIWEQYTTSTAAGRLIINQMLSFAQYESEATAVRINHVFDYKKSKKEVLSGKVPYGYKIINKHLVPDEEKADVVKRLFQAYINDGSICELVRQFEAYGLPKSQRGMKCLLRNEKYIGKAHGYDDYCEPIIDKQTFDTVQRMLDMNVRKAKVHDYIFSGLIVCRECGKKMVGTSDGYKDSRYYCYRCFQHYRPTHICPNSKQINEGKLEKYLVKNLESLAFTDVDERKKAKSDDLEWQIKVLEKKLAKLKDLYVNDLITIDEYRADMTNYKERIDVFRQKLKDNDYSDKVVLKELVGTNLDEWYWTLTNKERRTLWRRIIRKIEFGIDRSIEVTFV